MTLIGQLCLFEKLVKTLFPVRRSLELHADLLRAFTIEAEYTSGLVFAVLGETLKQGDRSHTIATE